MLLSLICSCKGQKEFIPAAPDYSDATMWYTSDSDSLGTGADIFYIVSTWEVDWTTPEGAVCHYADVWNQEHRDHMATEIKRIEEYMGPGNRFYAPYYRHATIEAWVPQKERLIHKRTRLSMKDVCEAFDHFIAERDNSRPFVIAGFSQGGLAVVELLRYMDDATYEKLAAAYVLGYKITREDVAACSHILPATGETDTGVTICYNTVKDVKYIKNVIAGSDYCINPVNWRTDSTPAVLHDTITVSVSPERHVLVVSGYSGSEYPPYEDFINVGDIHSCEPWLYSECLKENIGKRVKAWKSDHSAVVTSEELIRTSQSWDGELLPDYLKGQPELVAVRYEFPAGQKLGWHHHPVINYGVLVQGELTIIGMDGKEKTVHEGEAVVEMVGTIHHGENRGDKPVILYMFYLSQEGLPLAVQHPEIPLE